MSTISELIEKYGYDEPIILNDVKLNSICEKSIRQTFSRLAKLGKIKRYEQGVYYIPSESNTENRISAKKVYEKKYISNNKNAVFGFYSGLTFLHEIGVIDGESGTIEIVTNKQKSRVRKIEKDDIYIIIRRSRVKITPDNIETLKLLELVSALDVDGLTKNGKQKLLSYIYKQDIHVDDVVKYISKFPVRVAKSIMESGVFTKLSQ